MTHTLTIVAAFIAKPGQGMQLRDALSAMIAPSLAEDGCIRYQPLTDPSSPDRMILIEEWADGAALERHFSLPHFKHVATVLPEVLAEPFTLRRLTDVTA